MPTPARPPLTALTPARLTVITLVLSVTLELGVNRPVQVRPPSLEANPAIVPLGTVRSAVVKPVTAMLKAKVTVEVSPIFSAARDIEMVAEGVGATASAIWILLME